MASRRVPRTLEAGSAAPEFDLERLDGGSATLGGLLTAGPILLAFFKVTCPVCQLAFPYLDRVTARPVYGISQNDPEDTREFVRRLGLKMPVLLDAEARDFPVSNAYGIGSVPTIFEIEPGGKIARVVEGWSRRAVADWGAPVPAGVPEWKAG